ncbi:MAG: chorismate mutase [Chloroflexi bacterium]|nr:chorismate mutase [Chloroflexota bacterium]
MWCRGIRGATTVEKNTKDAIVGATRELLQKMVQANDIRVEDVAFVLFTTTVDLNAEFPAVAARQLGWENSALLCAHEMNVPDSLPRCIRVLVMINTNKSVNEIVHVYIKGAANLRPRVGAAGNTQHDR